MSESKDTSRRVKRQLKALPTFRSWRYTSWELKSTTDWCGCWSLGVGPLCLSQTHNQDPNCCLDFIKLSGLIESELNGFRLYNLCILKYSEIYPRNKTLMFAIMLTEKSLSWYSEILRLSMTESRDLQINPRNCIGTVLALNGHRKYFCMYHAKHPETSRGTKVSFVVVAQFIDVTN